MEAAYWLLMTFFLPFDKVDSKEEHERKDDSGDKEMGDERFVAVGFDNVFETDIML